MAQPLTRPDRRHVWLAILGVGISLALLWWSLRGVSVADVTGHIRAARPWPILLGVILATATFPLRIFRWRLLLRAEDGGPIRVGPLWHAIAMGFMANNVLPFRAGEVVRIYAVSRLALVRFTSALSSIAVERVFDALTIILFLALALLLPGMPADATIGGVSVTKVATRAGVLCLAALIAAAAVVAWPRAAETVVRRLLPFPRLAERIVGMIEGLRHGLTVLQSPARLAGVLLWSPTIWLVNAASFYLFFIAFGIPVNLAGALVLQGLLAFGIAVPSTPGYVGVVEAGVKAGLALYAIPADQAVSCALAYHFTTFVPITLLGLWSVARTGLGLRELRGAEP